MRLAKTIMETTRAIQDGINSIEGLRVVAAPDMSVFAFTSDTLDIHAVGDALGAQGWHPDRQQRPSSLHVMVTPAHADVAGQFLDALREAVRRVASGEQQSTGRAAVYGAMDKMADRGPVREMVFSALDRLTRTDGGEVVP
jgi:glutamate/tyrosine decarboxylase-like PLP-dependent enzyme